MKKQKLSSKRAKSGSANHELRIVLEAENYVQLLHSPGLKSRRRNLPSRMKIW